MHALSNWVTQIILIIMFAIVLELLLPSERFNRYVKTVVGLILILTLLSPVMRVFQMPVDNILNQMLPKSSNDPIKNSINNEKREIESGQRAYISKQMAVQMKTYVKGELSDRYGLVIQNLDLQVNASNPNDPIQHATVTLGQARSNSQTSSKSDKSQVTIDPIQKISVNSVAVSGSANQDQNQTSGSGAKEGEVLSFLSSQWNLAANKITLHLKGGGT